MVEKYPAEKKWHAASDRLSRYLLVTFCWQACNALSSVAQATVSPDQFERMKTELRWANLGASPKADTVGLWADRVAAVVFTETHDLYVASHNDELLKSFAQEWGLDLSIC